MTPRELAAQNGAKVFDAEASALAAGFVVTRSLAPRNVWNKASAAQVLMHELIQILFREEASEVGLIVTSRSVAGCYLPKHSGAK